MRPAFTFESAWSDATVQLMLQLVQGSGGFSLDKDGFPPPSSGYMVALGGDEHEIPLSVVKSNPSAVVEYYQNNRALLSLANHYVGGWVRGNQLVFEISQRILNHDDAIATAADRNEDEIWDLQRGRSIKVRDDI